jgi:hypothetical protein
MDCFAALAKTIVGLGPAYAGVLRVKPLAVFLEQEANNADISIL